MDFATLQTALPAFVKTFSGVPSAVFQDGPRGFTPETWALLSWLSGVTHGQPETRRDDDGVPTVTAHKTMVLQVAFESYRQKPDNTARQLCEDFLVRVHTPRADNELTALGLALANATDARNADYKANQHVVQRWVTELRLNATHSFTEAPQFTDGVIEHVHVISDTVNDPAGTPLPDSLQMDEEIP